MYNSHWHNSLVLHTVGDEPQVFEPLTDQTIVSPETATFTAKVNLGDPAATATWYANGQKVTPGKKYKPTTEGDVVTLEINDTEEKDDADYRVELVNKLGKVSSEAHLTVHGKWPFCLWHLDKVNLPLFYQFLSAWWRIWGKFGIVIIIMECMM